MGWRIIDFNRLLFLVVLRLAATLSLEALQNSGICVDDFWSSYSWTLATYRLSLFPSIKFSPTKFPSIWYHYHVLAFVPVFARWYLLKEKGCSFLSRMYSSNICRKLPL